MNKHISYILKLVRLKNKKTRRRNDDTLKANHKDYNINKVQIESYRSQQ